MIDALSCRERDEHTDRMTEKANDQSLSGQDGE